MWWASTGCMATRNSDITLMASMLSTEGRLRGPPRPRVCPSAVVMLRAIWLAYLFIVCVREVGASRSTLACMEKGAGGFSIEAHGKQVASASMVL